ncbi:O-antigen translocase [Polaribacter sp.]|uniref:O-antigen translocase n=1 Tax=Polaribacter sp. TaxID=1920175 RepID=UPI003F69C2CD
MRENQTSYRQVMKATSLFGGVQVFNIIISIIRSKVIALLLGPGGMGIIGLLTSSIGVISNLTNFGLGTSAVKDISVAYSTEDIQRISLTVRVFQRLVWITGILGTLVTIILSSYLSQLSFGDDSYSFAFVWLSVTLLFNQLSSGQLVLLQGMRKLQYLAKASLFGSVLGLLVTIPLYFFYGIDGIVPGIIGTSIITFLLSWFYSKKIEILPIKVSKEETIKEGRSMLEMGFMISLTGVLSVGASYVVRIFIGRIGGLEEVGLYAAGFAIINTYVGMIFNAMGTDYYPRLSAVSNDNKLCKQAINQQAEIAILILAPFLIIFFIFINWVIVFLYSKQFIDVSELIYWASLGMFFKAASWSISYVFIAKGASKLFFWNELITNVYLLGFNLLGYYFMGLRGLGLSFAVSYFLYLIQVYIISHKKFNFSFDKEFLKIFTVQFSIAILSFFCTSFLRQPFSYIIGLVLISFSSYYSFMELDRRLNLKETIMKIKNKF